jgi:hypothetical protein
LPSGFAEFDKKYFLIKLTLDLDGVVSQHWFNEQMSFSPSSTGQQGQL